jgi:hypothetical protein
MHAAAYEWVAQQVVKRGPFVSVLEVGSRNINGGVRDLFNGHDTVFEGVDIVDGPGVDYVCDATIELPTGPYDAVVCCEVFEHCARWPQIVKRAHLALMDRGVVLLTMAGPGRPPHSAADGGQLGAGEFYRNVEPACLGRALRAAGFTNVEVDVLDTDVRAVAVKGVSRCQTLSQA